MDLHPDSPRGWLVANFKRDLVTQEVAPGRIRTSVPGVRLTDGVHNQPLVTEKGPEEEDNVIELFGMAINYPKGYHIEIAPMEPGEPVMRADVNSRTLELFAISSEPEKAHAPRRRRTSGPQWRHEP